MKEENFIETLNKLKMTDIEDFKRNLEQISSDAQKTNEKVKKASELKDLNLEYQKKLIAMKDTIEETKIISKSLKENARSERMEYKNNLIPEKTKSLKSNIKGLFRSL